MKNDDSHGLDLVPVFSSSNHDAEMEATAIRALLDANGIPSVVNGSTTLPVLEFVVEVPEALLPDAQRVIQDARELGPKGAEEAELTSEEQ